MRLAWTADDPPAQAGPATGDGAPTLRRLSQVWDRSTISTDDRQQGMRELYERRHADMVRFAAFLTGDIAAAEDVAQDAFAKVFDAWDRIDDPAKLDAYLKSTVVNLVRGGHRRRQTAERHPAPRLSVVPSAEEDAIDELRRQRTLDAVADLPIRQRACVVMRHWMRLTESEIAETLDLSVGTVRTHVKRGMETLKHTLGGVS